MPPDSDNTGQQDHISNSAAWDARPMFALDADVTVYWPDVRPCWEPMSDSALEGIYE